MSKSGFVTEYQLLSCRAINTRVKGTEKTPTFTSTLDQDWLIFIQTDDPPQSSLRTLLKTNRLVSLSVQLQCGGNIKQRCSNLYFYLTLSV